MAKNKSDVIAAQIIKIKFEHDQLLKKKQRLQKALQNVTTELKDLQDDINALKS